MNMLSLIRTSILAIILQVVLLQKADAQTQTQVTWMNVVGAAQVEIPSKTMHRAASVIRALHR